MATCEIQQSSPAYRGSLKYVSPTTLNTWLSCPLKFKLRYVEGIETPTKPALFLGKCVHDGLAFFYRHLQEGNRLKIKDVTRYVIDSWPQAVARESVHFSDADDELSLRCQAVALLETYLSQVDVDEGVPIAVSSSLDCRLVDCDTVEDLGANLYGTLDLVLRAPTGIIVVDFTTSARSNTVTAISHEIQLGCHAYLLRHALGYDEEELQIRSLIKTKTPKVQTSHFPARQQHDFRRLFAAVRAYLAAIDTGKFIYRPGWTCAMCEYRETECQLWQG